MSKPPPDPLFVIRGDMSPAHCLLFHTSPDEEILFIGTQDGTVHVWDLKICKRKKVFSIGVNSCLSLHIIEKFLVTQDKLCEIKIWLWSENFELVHSQEFKNFSFCKINVLEGQIAYVAIPQPHSVVTLYLFNSPKFELLRSMKLSDENVKLGEVLSIKLFRIQSEYVAVIYESGMLIIWDIEGVIIMSEILTSNTPMSFDFDVNLRQGVCGTSGRDIIIFRLDENMKLSKRKTIEVVNEGTASLSIRPDGKIFVAGGWDGRIRIFSWKTCKLLAVLESHMETILFVCFSKSFIRTWNCNNVLAASASDQRISLWNIYE